MMVDPNAAPPVPSVAPAAQPAAPMIDQAKPAIDPRMLAAMLKASAGGGQRPGEAAPTLGSGGGGPQSLGQSMGGMAQAAQAAHAGAKPQLYNSDGSFNWSRALSNGWAPEVKAG